MLEKLGIVTNIWTRRLESGDRFEDLVDTFRENGFKYMELRDSADFRTCEFGGFLDELEAAMERYSDEQWKSICEHKERLPSLSSQYPGRDRSLFQRVADFAALTRGVTLTYAIPHPWMTAPDEIAMDDRRIVQAKKLAYLLCPAGPRLRLVDPDFKGPVAASETVSNLNRYRTLSAALPVRLCVENAHLPATQTLELALDGGVDLAYDEANIYDAEGCPLNPPGDFWQTVRTETLTSVHIKQKNADGVLPQIRDGYVDFKTIFKHLKEGAFSGDLLLENAPSEAPLEDALHSREYISELYRPL